MKFLIVSQYFWPEEFRINDLAIELVKKGHEVHVITGNPNYPKGDFIKGYGFKYLTETHHGVKIFRVPIFPRRNNSLMLILNYLSFIFFGGLFSYFHKEKYDRVFSVNYSPITAILPAIIYCKKNKVKLSIWVQDLWPESIIAASNVQADLTKENHSIQWVFIGDGRKFKYLKEIIKEKELTKTVSLLGRFPTESMPSFFKLADIMLVSLKDEYIFSLTVPGKVQSYMASSKPILAMLNGAGSKVVLEANCGLVANAGDYKKLAKNVLESYALSNETLESLGSNAFNFYLKNYSKEKLINNFIKVI